MIDVKKIILKILPYCLSAIFALLLVEIGLQFVQSGNKRSILLREITPNTSKDLLFNHTVFDSLNEELSTKVFHFQTDGEGFIGPSKIHQKADLTLVFLGGSTTECMFMDENKRFPYLVGRRLEAQTSLKVNSYNGGVSGNTSIHSLNILLNKVVPMHPQYVIFMHNINDLVMLLFTESYWTKHHKGIIVDNQNQGTLLQQTFPNINRTGKKAIEKLKSSTDEWEEFNNTPIQPNEEAILALFEKNLYAFVALCKAYKIQPVLMTQFCRFKENPDPMLYQHWCEKYAHRPFWKNETDGKKYEKFRQLFFKMNDKIREVGKQENSLVIDLARQIPQEKEYMYDYVHLNSRGSMLVAKTVAESLQLVIENKTLLSK